MRFINSLIASLAFLTCAATAQSYEPNWDSLSKHKPAPDWFRDAKFGIYFHWGVYTVPEFGDEWYPRNMYFPTHPAFKHHVKTYGPHAEFGYHKLVPLFTAEKFNAAEWVELFEQAGAKFAGPVAEHHDGFAMWPSKLTPWNAKDRGPKRDIVGEIAAEVKKRDMKLVTTFHHERHHQRHLEEKNYDKAEWWSHYKDSHFPPNKKLGTLPEDHELQLLYGNLPKAEFNDLWFGKLKEVIDAYEPDLIWFDSWLDHMDEEPRLKFYSYYFNKAKEWNKEVGVTHKKKDAPNSFSIEDFEKGRLDKLTENSWLVDDTISNGSWSYVRDIKLKPSSEIIHELADIVSKNGQLLLNICPRADGSIPDDQRVLLLDIGAWLKVNGDAIYGTRPYRVYGEGPTQMKKSGHMIKTEDKAIYTAKDIRYTTKGNIIYAIQLGVAPEGKLTQLNEVGEEKIKNVRLLGSEEKLEWWIEKHTLFIKNPKILPSKIANSFVIQTE